MARSKPDQQWNPVLLGSAAYAGMFVFGIVMALLGAVLPAISSRLQIELTQIGALFLVMNAAMLVCSLLLGVLLDSYGLKPPLMIGPLMVGAALLLIRTAEAYSSLLWAVVLLGIGGGALNSATNTLIADLHEDSRRKGSALNLLGVFFGFGALLLPFVIGSLIADLGIGLILTAAAILCVGIGIFAALLAFPPPKQGNRLPFAEIPQFLRQPAVLFMAMLLFFQSGNEFTLGGYISTYLTREFGVTVGTASYVLAGYWAALMLARVLLSRLSLRVESFQLLFWGALLASAGALFTASSSGIVRAAASVAILAFGLAGIYPTLLGIAGTQYREHSGTVFGILFTIALCGGMSMPWIAGQLAAHTGLRSVFLLVAVNFGVIFLLQFAIKKKAAPSSR